MELVARDHELVPRRAAFVVQAEEKVADTRDLVRDIEWKSLAAASLVGQQIVKIAFAARRITPERSDTIRDAWIFDL